ncbi:MAG TPA: carboxyl transferase domain-containing protein, partial [Acidimicrobiia bacterium]|nr:carboxyl transferase domain-containing protein [Acidimicrobiia bacterium]
MAIEESDIQEQAEAEALHGDEGGTAAEAVSHPLRERVEELGKLKEAALHAGSPAAIERQHARGKLTARERLEILLDPGSFVELDMLARHRAHGFEIEKTRPLTDGVITGWGTVDGRKIFVFSQDFTVFGGALGEVFAEKIHKVMDLAESV